LVRLSGVASGTLFVRRGSDRAGRPRAGSCGLVAYLQKESKRSADKFGRGIVGLTFVLVILTGVLIWRA
jgi:hypothetical protein